MLEMETVRFGYAEQPDFLGPISLQVRPGECWALVGPNGAGKSTLLRLMAGLYIPSSGEIRIFGKTNTLISLRDRARRIAFVPQHAPVDLDFPVREVVVMGRFPHRSLGLFDSQSDYRIADNALATTGTLEFANRSLATLSGGEAQRVHIAAALAQEPNLMLLDEPTSSLDLRHQIAIFAILRRRADVDGLAVVVVTHDVNLAARYCSNVLLMHEGRAAAMGTPDDVIAPEVLAPVYGVAMETLTRAGGADRGWVVPIDEACAEPL